MYPFLRIALYDYSAVKDLCDRCIVRSLKAERLLKQIIGNTNNEIIFLEHLEILFDTSLQLDPLRCLQKLARNCTIVALWSGNVENNHLIYAEREHPEYKIYPIDGFLVVNLE